MTRTRFMIWPTDSEEDFLDEHDSPVGVGLSQPTSTKGLPIWARIAIGLAIIWAFVVLSFLFPLIDSIW